MAWEALREWGDDVARIQRLTGVVMTFIEGRPPEAEDDWRRVADTLRQLHRLTEGWPQRPGCRSSTELLHVDTGTKIDLRAMPPEGATRCRAAWARLTDLDDNAYDIAAQAQAAWEAAVCWDDEHARKRLAEVRAADRKRPA
jgi:hypothetical protein